MKKICFKKQICLAAGLAVMVVVVMGCVTSGTAPASTAAEVRQEQDANNVGTQARRSTVIDWSNRNLGEDSVPLWLKPLVKGISGPV
jgi:ABC-type Fe3+-citrate transport system substrate-binding protein